MGRFASADRCPRLDAVRTFEGLLGAYTAYVTRSVAEEPRSMARSHCGRDHALKHDGQGRLTPKLSSDLDNAEARAAEGAVGAPLAEVRARGLPGASPEQAA